MSLRVHSIEWLSEEALEAEVRIAGDSVSFVAFSHPCTASPGEPIEELHARDAASVRVTHARRASIANRDGRFECDVVGLVRSAKPAVVNVGGTRIVLGLPLPGDVGPGQWVEFHCARIDLPRQR